MLQFLCITVHLFGLLNFIFFEVKSLCLCFSKSPYVCSDVSMAYNVTYFFIVHCAVCGLRVRILILQLRFLLSVCHATEYVCEEIVYLVHGGHTDLENQIS